LKLDESGHIIVFRSLNKCSRASRLGLQSGPQDEPVGQASLPAGSGSILLPRLMALGKIFSAAVILRFALSSCSPPAS